MSSEPDSGERYGEYVQRQTSRQQSYSRQNTLKEGVKNANEHLAKGRHYEAACILREVVLPTINELEAAKPMSVYHNEIGSEDDLPWYWSALKWFKNQPHRYCQAVAAGNATTVLDGDTHRVTQTIRRAVASAESIVAYHDITESSMKNRETTVEDIQNAESRVDQTTDVVAETVEAFADVKANVEETNNGIQEISKAMEDQATTTERVVSRVDDVAEISQSTADRAENVSAASEKQTSSITEVTAGLDTLVEQADELEARLNEFTVGDSVQVDSNPARGEQTGTDFTSGDGHAQID